MLELKGITKDYKAGDMTVHALKGVSVKFRDSEFVSILGPSGCGKTTLLNIIGGLDHYTTGDMFIDGISTKEYDDRDWDSYRNHRVGFVFQSYNLIPHQTILENVELALTIAGVGREERVRRSKEALDKVGLAGLYNKKPNQLSGGQCQRVSIARALVNKPNILLADEPTGALDTQTSIQIMELIKEISKNCLVVMVTHNPELAEKYSTRIIRVLDGEIVDDSNPYNECENNATENAENYENNLQNAENNLSQNVEENSLENAEANADIALQNLTSNSQNMQDNSENEQHSLQIIQDNDEKAQSDDESAQSQDAIELNNSSTAEKSKKKKNKANRSTKSKLSFWQAFKLSSRNLRSKFKRTLMVCIAGSIGIIGVASVLALSTGVQKYIDNMQNDMLSGNPVTISESAKNYSAMLEMSSTASKKEAIKSATKDGIVNVDHMIDYLVEQSSNLNSFNVSNNITENYLKFIDTIPKEYYSAITKEYGLGMLNNIYTDINFTSYGKQKMSLSAIMQVYTGLLKTTKFKEYAGFIASLSSSFNQLIDNDDFILSQYEIVSDPKTSKLPKNADEIMIVLDENGCLQDLLLAELGYYSQDEFINLVYKAVGDSYDESLIKNQFNFNELMGKSFTWYPNNTIFDKNEDLATQSARPFYYNAYADSAWTDGIELKVTAVLKPKANVSYGSLSSGFYYTPALTLQALENGLNSEIVAYMNDNRLKNIKSETVNGEDKGITFKYSFYANGIEYTDNTGYVGSSSMMNIAMGIQDNAHTLTLRHVGGCALPNSIKIYPTNFSYKDDIVDYLEIWNSDETIIIDSLIIPANARSQIVYVDNLSLVISMINEMISIITTALIAFTALSLVVSTVMISIITYVSVIERIKEIGVIRSLGGRKRDVSRLFNAETVIIGGISGLIGILITYLIVLILNLTLGSLIAGSIACLPVWMSLVMIVLSIGLTSISGLIPARIAAKKDPVEALRNEG